MTTFTGTAGNDVLIGGSGNDTLSGLGGDDTLIGVLGTDLMTGGDGNDTYSVENTGDLVVETSTLSTEIDTVRSAISYTLGANLENLILTVDADIDGTGNSRNNRITGNAADNTLDGVLGTDLMTGGDGNDTFLVENVGDLVVETSTAATQIDTVRSAITSYTLGANLENLVLVEDTAAINGTGNSLNNTIIGNVAVNSLVGGAGDDSLVGDSGADFLDGGAGDDFLDGGIGADNLNGGIGADNLNGDAGDDFLDGGAGANQLMGGDGSDVYVVDEIVDEVTETSVSTSEIDTVRSAIGYTLGVNLENLILLGTDAIDGTGNGLNNTIIGNGAINTLVGGAGDDILSGGAGVDQLTGGTGADLFRFNSPLEGIDAIADFDTTVEGELIGIGAGFGATTTDQFTYNAAAGSLFFNDGGGPVQFASLGAGTNFNVATDISFV